MKKQFNKQHGMSTACVFIILHYALPFGAAAGHQLTPAFLRV